MGRVMSGLGGEIIMNKANEVLKTYGADKNSEFCFPTKISEGSDNRSPRRISAENEKSNDNL